MGDDGFDADVIVVGSGFGGSVAALRFSEAGQSVLVLERGPWVSRETHEVDLDALWMPSKHRFGFNELRPRGKCIVPWLGACVGGGSYVYAGTLKRVDDFDDWPDAIAMDDMVEYYERAEDVMEPRKFPDYPPYSDIKATQLLYGVGETLKKQYPELVESYGPINLGISFAPKGGTPGAAFTNKHGAEQHYSDPREQSLLGGDIGAKNTLDKNYLHLAQKKGAKVEPLVQVDRIERDDDGWTVHGRRYLLESSWARQVACKWLPWVEPRSEAVSFRSRRLVLAAGAVGSTELLLRNRDVHQTLTALSPKLGESYTTNGDFISLILPFRGIFVAWAGFIAALVGGIVAAGVGLDGLRAMHWSWLTLAAGVLAYFGGLLISQRAFDPDLGTTNSDYIKFRGRDGSSQGAYIESGRYPTPVRLGIAVFLSAIGLWRPRRYAKIVWFTKLLQWTVPPFAVLARSWPIPLLSMGRDDVRGRVHLDEKGDATIDYPVDGNKEFYAFLNDLGKKIAKAANARWAPNFLFPLTGRLEIPHNQGGVPMGESADEGVVDHAGRVYGYTDLMVLDGSIIPCSPGPNPALTILALAERGCELALQQLETEGTIHP